MGLPTPSRLVVCLLTFPLSGIIAIGALFLRGFVGMPGEDLAVWAQMVSSTRYLISQYGYIIAYVLPFFGFWALYMVLMHHNLEKLAFWGLMGALLGTGLPLTTLGVLAYASPIMGELYLQGEVHLPQIINDIAMGSSMVMGMPGAFLYTGGCILFSIAIWKSSAFPRLPGVLLALHGILISFGFGSSLLLLLSWILLIMSGSWLAWLVWKERNPA